MCSLEPKIANTNPQEFISSVYPLSPLPLRAPSLDDYRREILAVNELSASMAEGAQDMLPRLVALAMEFTDGIAGGLSLIDNDVGVEGAFRWHCVQGTIAAFDGSVVPRFHSPCEVALRRNEAVITRNPERIYEWISEYGVTVEEALLVPLWKSPAEPLGTLWIVGGKAGHFDSEHVRIASGLAQFACVALRQIRQKEELREALEEQELLAGEMSHRVKNCFAVVAGMVRESARTASTVAEMQEILSGRITALAAAHSLAQRQTGQPQPAGKQQSDTDLADLLRRVMAPHRGSETNIRLSGPQVTCGERATSGLALVLHELATNSAKYGALAVPGGQVSIDWHLDGGRLNLVWSEQGGATVISPLTPRGFGSILVERIITRQFGGAVDFQWHSDGLVVTCHADSTRLSE